jgi:phosphohistidine phosphatase SixA
MRLPILLLFILLTSGCYHNIYIVRHAEKSTDPKNDPYLTAQGEQRAEALKLLLQNKKIKQIFSTNTNRTKETAKPMSSFTNIPIQLYNNDTISNFYKHIFLSKKNTLVIGHSNTVLNMLDTLGLVRRIQSIGDKEYDNIFIVKVKKYCSTCKNKFKTSLVESKYGKPSVVDSVENTMN